MKSFCVIHRNCILIGKRRGAQSSGKLVLKKIVPSGMYFSALILVTFRTVDFFPGLMVFRLPKSKNVCSKNLTLMVLDIFFELFHSHAICWKVNLNSFKLLTIVT